MLQTSEIASLGLPPKRRGPAILSVSVALGLVVVGSVSSLAGTQTVFDNSLWIGTDNTSSRNVLNMDRSGALLRSVGPVECTGFAFDPVTNVIYFGSSTGGITVRDLATLGTGESFSAVGSEDMTFDGTSIWRTGTSGPASSTVITKIDPVAHTSTPGFTAPFQTVGIAWDGSGFWIDSFATDGIVQRFDPAGLPTGESFHTQGGHINGGLAYDMTDNTLFVGTFGGVYHYSTTGTPLGSFSIPADQSPGRFIDGLEFESASFVGVGKSLQRTHLSFSVWPNPSHGRVVFAVEAPGPKRLRIFGLTGRLVREMRNLDMAPGRVDLIWDGRDGAGTQMPDGVYYAQVWAGANSQVRRFSLIH